MIQFLLLSFVRCQFLRGILFYIYIDIFLSYFMLNMKFYIYFLKFFKIFFSNFYI
jgi:hypothetical protein